MLRTAIQSNVEELFYQDASLIISPPPPLGIFKLIKKNN